MRNASGTIAPVTKRIDVVSRSRATEHKGRHRFEHWLADNQVYFITARTREGFAAFESAGAAAIFWNRFDHYTSEAQFTPWVTTLLNNHYHTIGYLKVGEALPRMMQRIHGSVAKLVNDLLPERRRKFWRGNKGREYLDGCIRDEPQARRAYRYTLTQATRAQLVSDWRDYPNTRVNVELDRAIRRAVEIDAFLSGVKYKRYLEAPGPAR
jgi:hypothetical protein